eukprot:m.252826 g.252826  ORF g.252826 m.252826 type:complete len:245 (+) comp16157_c2_seq1:121-855(+)
MVKKFLMEGAYTKESGFVHKLKDKFKASHSSSSATGLKPDQEETFDNLCDISEKEDETEYEFRSDIQAIPVRVLLLILDEIFELRGNRWLRRGVVTVLKNLMRGFFGDNINRKVTDAINSSFSPVQVAAYAHQFKEAWWPDGNLAPEVPPRSEDCKTRTAIEARAKLFGTLPDELKRLVGKKTAKQGMHDVFEMLQIESLNRRLVLALLETFLIKMFPANNMVEILSKIHNNCDRLRDTIANKS